MKIAHVLTGLGLAAIVAGCQQKSETSEAPASPDIASAAAVTRILAMPVMSRCGSENPDKPAPTGTRVIDLGGGAFAILADCAAAGEPADRSLFVQGADGVLKHQGLILYNGPEYTDGYDWEPVQTADISWEPATKTFVTVATVPANDTDPMTKVSTMRWRWDGSKIAMVEASRVTHATPQAPATAPVTGWPKTPAVADPTPAAEPV
jgi:hypothetical protein